MTQTTKVFLDGNNVDDAGEDALNIADAMMLRGAFLRQLRLLEEKDEEERLGWSHQNNSKVTEPYLYTDDEEKKERSQDEDCSTFDEEQCNLLEDTVRTLPDGKKILDYNSFLAHQRYYDDLKHSDVNYIDYGNMAELVSNKYLKERLQLRKGSDSFRLIIEQEKSLGKGGLCWDAGFVLGEHLIANESEWNKLVYKSKDSNMSSLVRKQKVVDLGGGTGLSGIMVSKVCDCHVTITDMPDLVDLIKRNIHLNFDASSINPAMSTTKGMKVDMKIHKALSFTRHENELINKKYKGLKTSVGHVTARVLQWGVESDYEDGPYDVIIGADIVASLYNPIALAQTLYALSSNTTKVYLCLKYRLNKPHELFETELGKLFRLVERRKALSCNKNPDLWILYAEGKI